MTWSTKPKVQNIFAVLSEEDRATRPQVNNNNKYKNIAKFGYVILTYASGQSDRHAKRQTDRQTSQ